MALARLMSSCPARALGCRSVRRVVCSSHHLLDGRAIQTAGDSSKKSPKVIGAGKRLDGTVREDTLLVNKTEWPAIVAGCMSQGKLRIILTSTTVDG